MKGRARPMVVARPHIFGSLEGLVRPF